MKPLCIDGYCGLGGWADGFLAEGWDVIGFDIERHDYGTGGYPGQLVIQDVRTLDGAQFKNADCLVFSPPCQCYSYMAMPWTRAKKIAAEYRDGTRSIADLNALFDACFRIQREASAAAGHHIPMVVENVKGAQPWVGRAAWHHGSFYLWGDVPALMPFARANKGAAPMGTGRDKGTGSTSWFFGTRADPRDMRRNEDGEFTRMGMNNSTAVKNGNDWFGSGENYSLQRRASSCSSARKAASAQIAKIPFPLAQWIARCFKPEAHRLDYKMDYKRMESV